MKFQWSCYEDSFDVWPKTQIEVVKNESYCVEIVVTEQDFYDNSRPETVLTITVKWDGCCHVYYGDKDENGDGNGYMHHCGSQRMSEYFALVQCCYMLAQKLMEAQGQTDMSETSGCGYKDFKSQHFGYVRNGEVLKERTQ